MAVVGKTSEKPSDGLRYCIRTDKEIIIAAIERSQVEAFLPEINVFPEKSFCRHLLFRKAIFSGL
jgi:hypothetical protein